MQNIIPVTDLQRKAASILDELKKTRKPIIITQRGRAAAVLISAEHYGKIEEDLALLEELEIRRAIELAEKDIAAGNTISMDAVKKRLGFKN